MKLKTAIAFVCISLFTFSCRKDYCVAEERTCEFDVRLGEGKGVLTEEQNDKYFAIWKSIMLEKSNMSEAYFFKHITEYTVSSQEWNEGVSFRVNYVIHVDWIDIACYDNFIVKLNSNSTGYTFLDKPKDVFLEQDDIRNNVEGTIYSEISKYNTIEKIKYKNCKEIYSAVMECSGYSQIILDRISYYVPGKLPREDGNPYCLIRGEICELENTCLTGRIDLVSGECEVRETVCWVN